MFVVDQLSQVYIWLSHLETMKADRRKVGNEIRMYFLRILQALVNIPRVLSGSSRLTWS